MRRGFGQRISRHTEIGCLWLVTFVISLRRRPAQTKKKTVNNPSPWSRNGAKSFFTSVTFFETTPHEGYMEVWVLVDDIDDVY